MTTPAASSPPTNRIVLADNLDALLEIEDESIPLIYIDPPFNTGQVRRTRD